MRRCDRAGVLLAFLVLSLTGSAEAHTHLKTSSATAGAATCDVRRLPAPLKPGADQVNGRVMSADSHKVQGSFTFRVRP